MADFDFDELMYIAKNELEIFEQKREERIASFMDSSNPSIKKLGQIQKRNSLKHYSIF